MRLYNRKNLIRFLTVRVRFPAFPDLFGLDSLTQTSKSHLSFAGMIHTCTSWEDCLSPTPAACTTL